MGEGFNESMALVRDRVKRVDSFVRDTIKIRNLLTNLELIYIYNIIFMIIITRNFN